jgi:cytochrome P450
VVQAGLIWVAPMRFLQICHRRYGDRFTVRIPKMGATVYLSDPDDIRSVMRGDPAMFHAGEANALIAEIVGGNSVAVLDDEAHRRSRAMMLPAFHGDSVRRQVSEMVAITAEQVAGWPIGDRFPMLPRMQAITLEVILRTVIGVHEQDRLAALRTALPPMVQIGSPLELLPPPQVLRNVGLWRRREQRKTRAHALLRDEITQCHQDPRLEQRSDALAMLVRTVDATAQPMTDNELVDQLLTLLLAGHETTATALAWTFERLIRDPALLDRTARSAQSGDNAWLDAVCKESLRVRPVVYQVNRRLTKPLQLAAYRIPAGTTLAPSIELVQHSARHYPEPEVFRPQRFLDQRADPSIWFPFGGGVRRCLGATFALVEMRTVLGEVLRRVELAPTTAPAEQARARHVMLVPHQGAMVRIQRHIPHTTTPAGHDNGSPPAR